MDFGTLLGLILGLGLIFGAIISGGDIGGFIDVPSIMIVFGGTLAGTMVMFPLSQVLGSIKVALNAMKVSGHDPARIIRQMMEIAKKARKDGLLSLQNFKSTDRFLNKAMQMTVDGMDQNVIREVLTTEIEKLRFRHMTGAQFFEQVGLLAPAFGMIGTLVGLVQMLQNLSDPSSIGPAMAVALLTTFYGAIFANLVCIPIAKKLEIRSAEETISLELIMEGVISIIKKENPSIMKSKLNAFLNPKLQHK
ncbi:MAG: MotA/TolQ/ExbB proton channel family protein [Nitrospinota bacterium]|nr:MotA/TolQ/ExbB proton channel family protein [Nitrospinota bacterium]